MRKSLQFVVPKVRKRVENITIETN